MPRLIDLTGMRFGKLVVIRREGWKQNRLAPAWLVKCDCGNEKVIRGVALREGWAKSCGCSLTKHGMYGTPEYNAWRSMKNRCENPQAGNYRLYGARGISICKAWTESFEAFLADMGRRPSKDHSLDRINNDGNYEPGNCRWATRKQQQRNRRVCHVLTVGSVSATIAEWAERTGIGKTTIRERLHRGWSAERATGITAR